MEDNMTRYKIAALIGTIIMAIGSFMACLCEAAVPAMAGNILLVISIVIMFYGYSRWQP